MRTKKQTLKMYKESIRRIKKTINKELEVAKLEVIEKNKHRFELIEIAKRRIKELVESK